MVEIQRMWSISDEDLNERIEMLYKRPRVDYRISEYIYEYINKRILVPNKIMQTGDYLMILSFATYYKNVQNILRIHRIIQKRQNIKP
jgi:hypothetical protein